ncbi:MAG: methylenetetrahydrofolate--tRNA-(uracil(54)-C(5))-methyltransferase (FADH(2)-oxidizing) TrmFO, partial [Bacilli bacterium]|nr:methylenetetrahydrofolate--tRNA-(uracil(54)-C(5))-methyltransferase (FADH(2)-oxidizing) TrmFO [Bacilli bacterium]
VDDQAHETGMFGELVCSNSLKSKLLTNACGLLKEEMRRMDSILMESALANEVPSGNALGVDRNGFAKHIDEKLRANPCLIVKNEDISEIDFSIPTIVATGPLTSGPLLNFFIEKIGAKSLSFFDASAPIVTADSINMDIAYLKSRYEQDDAAYINCPMSREEYYAFWNALQSAERVIQHGRKDQFFEACLPIEVIASRGRDTLAHGPLNPKGLRREEGHRPFAVVQLRQDDKLASCYNLVGFQTNLTYPEQDRVFRMIPGLENAKFIRHGLMHENAFINSPDLLNHDLSLRKFPWTFVAGQFSGVEGYVESAASGIMAAINIDRKIRGLDPVFLSKNTILGALISYISTPQLSRFEPMNANWQLIPGTSKDHRQDAIDASLKEIDEFWRMVNE